MVSLEILIAKPNRHDYVIEALADAARADGDKVVITRQYRGQSDWLCLWGVGHPTNNAARNRQVKMGKKALLWDLGYAKRKEYFRCSINSDHPPQYFDETPSDPIRFNQLDIELKDEYDPNGHILLVGLGIKTRKYLGNYTWDEFKLRELKKRFPGKRIVFRPKGADKTRLACEIDLNPDAMAILKGCSLVVTRHSNMGIDALIRKIPYETETGAAKWLKSLDNRQEFLNKLAYWQWKSDEMRTCWQFVKSMAIPSGSISVVENAPSTAGLGLMHPPIALRRT